MSVSDPSATTSSSATYVLREDRRVKFDWTEDTLLITALVPRNTYFAVGFGRTMTDTDMIIWQNYGIDSPTTDLWSTGYSRPSTDSR